MRQDEQTHRCEPVPFAERPECAGYDGVMERRTMIVEDGALLGAAGKRDVLRHRTDSGEVIRAGAEDEHWPEPVSPSEIRIDRPDRRELDRAVRRTLRRAGLTLTELQEQARTGQLLSEVTRMTWFTISAFVDPGSDARIAG